MSTNLGKHTHIIAPPLHSPLQQTQPELRHVSSTSSRSHKRAYQVHEASEARLGSRSPGSVSSSSSSVYYSASSAIPEYPVASPLPRHPPLPPIPSYLHPIPRVRFTGHLEQSVPFILDSAAEILTDPEAGDHVAVTPAASSFNEYSRGFASLIGRRFRNQNLSPLTESNSPSDLTPAASSFNEYQVHETSAARLGSRSPGSVSSSSSVYYSSSSAIPEYPVAPPLPAPPLPPITSYIQRIPRVRFTEPLEQSVPFILDSAAEILTRHQDPEAGDQGAVVTPAASSFNGYTGRSSGFTRSISRRLRSQNPGPLTERDLPSDPRLYKPYLCHVFSIQFTDVIDLTGHINRHRFIAAGGSGEVWEASWQGLNNNRLIGTPKALPMVVVKLVRLPPIKDTVSKDKRYKRMKRELLLWSKLNHPHILPFIGVARIEGDANLPAFISPWMENGNVMEFLKQNPSFPASRFLKDIIKGLHYLHTRIPVIVHGDLKGANVLINHRKEACLCDFGLSRLVVDNTLWRTTATHAHGTLRWMAPELIQDDIIVPTIATDIYAFGMTSYEILSRGSPFAAMNDFAVMKKVTDGQRPAKIESCHSDEMWFIITRCWAHEPEDRPSTEETLQLVLQHATLST